MAHTILHIPRSNINGVSSPYGRLPFLDFLVNAESLIYLEDNVHIWFQEPQTKLWLFDTVLTLHTEETWERSCRRAHNWTDLERPLSQRLSTF